MKPINHANLIFQMFFISVIALLLLPSFLEDEPCIEKEPFWCDLHQQQEQRWVIDGQVYLARPTPQGGWEVVGLASRFGCE